MNRGKAQISFGNKDLNPEKSNYFSLNAEYRDEVIAVSVTGFLNRINDMVVKENIKVDDVSLAMLRKEFPEMTDDQASKLEQYALYQNSDKGDVRAVRSGRISSAAFVMLPPLLPTITMLGGAMD